MVNARDFKEEHVTAWTAMKPLGAEIVECDASETDLFPSMLVGWSSLVGDASKALVKLGWKATTPWQDLCAEMVKADLAEAKRESHLAKAGL